LRFQVVLWEEMMRQAKIPSFKDDREAAEFWATHDSTPYQRELREAAVKASPELRRRIAARAETKQSKRGKPWHERKS